MNTPRELSMRISPTYEEICKSWSLWIQYVDINGIGTQKDFYKIPMEKRIEFMVECFGIETEEDYE